MNKSIQSSEETHANHKDPLLYLPNKIYIIINPHGGKRKNQTFLKNATDVFTAANVKFQVCETQYPRHAYDYSQQIVFSKGDIIVCIGGDGTIYEVINGLMNLSNPPPLGIIPGGSSNYLAQSIGLKLDDPQYAAHRILSGCLRKIDLAKITINSRSYYAACAITWGYLVDLVACSDNLRWLGINRYNIAGLHELWQSKPRQGKISIDNGRIIQEGKFSFFMAYNTEYQGRNQILDQDAMIDDGLWDCMFLPELSKFQLAKFLASLKTNTWLNFPQLTKTRFTSLIIETQQNDPINLDGEDNLTSPLTIGILPRALKIIASDYCHPNTVLHMNEF